MAQGDYWRLAVGVPLINPDFNIPTTLGLVLASGHSVAATTLSCTAPTTPGAIFDIVQGGDYVTVGPSTHANNPGATETFKVISISSSVFSIEGGLAYAYSSGDPVYCIGTKWPGGWAINDGNTIQNTEIVTGYRDLYAFEADYTDTGTVPQLTIGTTNSTNKDSPLPDLMPSTLYRLAFFYKGTALANSNNIVQLRCYNQTPTLQTFSSSALTTQANWTESAGTLNSPSTSLSGTLSIMFESSHATTGNTATDWGLDAFVLSHAKGTSTASSGFITFPEFTDFGSIAYGSRIKPNQVEAGARLYQTRMPHDHGSVEKYEVSGRFSNITQAFYNDLMVLLDYQRKGNPIAFWPFIDDLPHAMLGYIDVWPMIKSHWDLSEREFNLRFTEM